jgi:putative ABC transport system ATP-binding protein
MLRLSKISRCFLTEEVETTALDAIDLAVDAGEFIAIMGPSGCGKSTLLNVLGTIDRPSEGSYTFNGTDLARMEERRLAQFRAERLGFVFQSFNLIDELTIAENIELGLAYRPGDKKKRTAKIDHAMDRVGIAHRAGHFPNQLSGGQQQRAAIARAIVGDPELILADEPTGNLDSANGAEVMEILRALNGAGATIIMVTHSPSHADVASRRIDMLDGRIVSTVAPQI